MRNYLLEGDFKALSNLQTKEQDSLLALSNVVGVGLGNKQKNGIDTGEPSLLVLVNQKLEKSDLNDGDLIPATIGKYKTDVVEIGDIFALTNMQNNDRVRPTMGGSQIHSAAINGWGTLGTTVIRRNATIPTQYYVLSNQHVLGNAIGADVFQPNTNLPADKIADLSQFVPFGGTNVVDCAIAEVLEFDKCSPEIYGIGYIEGVTNVQINTRVQKSGARTGYTRGRVIALNATVTVNYGGVLRNFVNQIITTNMSAPGDSGSIGLDMRNNAFGLLFAGSSTATIFNPISAVLNALQIEFLGV